MENDNKLQNIAQSLVKAQLELKNPDKLSQAYGYKYADLPSILEAVKPVLANNDLAITQMPYNEGDLIGVRTMLIHKSGEYLESIVAMLVEIPLTKDGRPSMTKAQAVGSIITYARRYALSAMLNIAADEDTDAVTPLQKKPIAQPKMNSYQQAKAEAKGAQDVAKAQAEAGHGDMSKSQAQINQKTTNAEDFASDKQIKMLYAIVHKNNKSTDEFREAVKKKYGLMSMDQLTKAQFNEILGQLQPDSSKRFSN